MIQVKLDTILQMIEDCSLEDQDFIAHTITKRINELRRNQILERAKEAEANYLSGNVQVGTVNELMNSIDND
jgi:hypothetical protein